MLKEKKMKKNLTGKEVKGMRKTVLTGMVIVMLVFTTLGTANAWNMWDAFLAAVRGVTIDAISRIWNYAGGALVSQVDLTTGNVVYYANGNIWAIDAAIADIDEINRALGTSYETIEDFLEAEDGRTIEQKTAIIAANSTMATTTYVYDGNGHLTQTWTPVIDKDGKIVRDAAGNTLRNVTTYINGQAQTITGRYWDETSQTWKVGVFTYYYTNGILDYGEGLLGLIGASGGARGSEIESGKVIFDSQGRIKEVWNSETNTKVAKYTYDASGNLSKLEALNALGIVVQTTTNYYAGKLRMTSITIDNTTGETISNIQFTYSQNGTLLYSDDLVTQGTHDTPHQRISDGGNMYHDEWDLITDIERTYYLFGKPIFVARFTLGSEHHVGDPYRIDPVVTGTIRAVVEIDGHYYLVLDADGIDLLDGSGLQSADGETFLVEVDEATAENMRGRIGESIVAMGDITSDVNGYLTIRMNPTYGGGVITGDNVDGFLATYTQQSWYQQNLASMSRIWGEVKATYGNYSTWRQGFEFLKSLLGL